jgi:DNA-binding NtrC family response regulator
MDDGSQQHTLPFGDLTMGAVRRFAVEVIEPAELATTWRSTTERCAIGAASTNELVLDHNTVSRFHCEIVVDGDGVRVVDLGSRNGTLVDGVRIERAWLRDGSHLRLGAASLRFHFQAEVGHLPLSEQTELGRLVGRSVAMRTLFAVLERAARSDATVLLEGETGTGKGAAAEVLHQGSARKDGPFIVVDCGAIPANLLESELFGYEKGAFTGADTRRTGAFEAASGGTIFLDEIGELPSELQPKLLRVLESRTIKRIGSHEHLPIDVRIIAATNRDLRAETNRGDFRADLYFRLAVVRATLPPLRERPDDIPAIAVRLLAQLGASSMVRGALLTPSFLATLARVAWPGNVRELRNYLERCLVFEGPLPTGGLAAESPPGVDASRSYADERERALAQFEHQYAAGLMRAHGGNVTKAAAAAGITRVHLYRLLHRHNVARG